MQRIISKEDGFAVEDALEEIPFVESVDFSKRITLEVTHLDMAQCTMLPQLLVGGFGLKRQKIDGKWRVFVVFDSIIQEAPREMDIEEVEFV